MTETNGNAAPNSNVELEVLFQSPQSNVVFSGANQLAMTARLTQVSTMIANQVLKELYANTALYKDKIVASQKSHDAMDDLIGEIYPLGADETEWLEGMDAEEMDKMIRSQQSKRSRAKGKIMTTENYKVMMIGAVAENLLRIASGKQKSIGGGAAMGDVGFDDEDLEALAAVPEDLKKAIRNVQSKKSIMKSKAGFSEDDARWQQLLIAEAQLKAVRDRGAAELSEEAKHALDVKNQAEELLADVDTDSLSPEEAATLLRSVKEMLVSK